MGLYGLVLSGGKSLRMGTDKGAMIYPPSVVDQRERCHDLLSSVCEKVFVSIRESQRASLNKKISPIVDSFPGEGPGVGILSAHLAHPNHAWFVLACDFPYIEIEDILHLSRARDSSFAATHLLHEDQTPEPFFTIWEPEAIQSLIKNFDRKNFSPMQTLRELNAKKISPISHSRIQNVNSRQFSSASLRFS